MTFNIRKTIQCAAACATALFLVSCGEGPSDVVIKTNELMADGNVKETVAYFNTTAEKKEMIASAIEQKALPKMQEELKAKGGLSEIKIIDEDISDDGKTATVSFKTIYGDGSSSTDSQKLECVDGKWMLEDPFKNK
ncbi:MAG: DUF4878 domain-containing protein [Akkermansia sp.]